MDITADVGILKEVKQYTNLPVCVSSISLLDLYHCATEGVDLIEIGNYDYFYSNNIQLSPQQIFNLAVESRKLFSGLSICVTVPGFLSLKDQILLSKSLEDIGIQQIQTESIKPRSFSYDLSLSNLIDRALPVLSSTYAISSSVNIPVVASSGINSILASLAILYGASGVGVSTAINNYSSLLMKSIYIQELYTSMNSHKILSSNNFMSSIYNSSGLTC